MLTSTEVHTNTININHVIYNSIVFGSATSNVERKIARNVGHKWMEVEVEVENDAKDEVAPLCETREYP